MVTQTQTTLSTSRSIWLRVVAWLFKLGGALSALMALFTLAFGRGWSPSAGKPSYPTTLFLSAMAAGLLATGFLLARRARAGAFLALAITLYPLVFVATRVRPFSWLDAVGTVITVAVIASIWPELRSHQQSSRAA